MASNIIAIVCTAVAAVAGAYVMWLELRPDKKSDDKDDLDK